MSVRIRRVYAPAGGDEGYRVLVDRVWPRGVTSDDSGIDLWMRGIAPSTALRTWFGHEVEKWPEFRKRYEAELETHSELLELLGDIEHHNKTLTLLFGAKDEEHNQAVVLADFLRHRS